MGGRPKSQRMSSGAGKSFLLHGSGKRPSMQKSWTVDEYEVNEGEGEGETTYVVGSKVIGKRLSDSDYSDDRGTYAKLEA
jgi:hypothetical protein